MKKVNYLLCFLIIFARNEIAAQAAPLYSVCSLPAVINESSGIEKTGPNTFWSHNDSGGQPAIYKFDSSGVLLQTITITNATNIDWEDIAEDDNGNFYIGDFGNNNNDRSVANNNRLRIYKIGDPDLIIPSTTTASVIYFEYVDRNFATPAGNHNFDMEAFFFFNDSLHLFTKNRTSPTNGWIKHYILPSAPGTYTAMLVDSFNNGGVRITAADISPNKKTVALLAQTNIWLFSCYKGSKFLSTGSNTMATLPITQKEAIVFTNDSMVYITDEFTNPIGQKLYKSNLRNFIAKPLALSGTVTPACPNVNNGSVAVSVGGGVAPFTYTWSNNIFSSNNSSLFSGSYSVNVVDSKGCKIGASYTVTNYTVLPVVIQFSNNILLSSSMGGNQWYYNGSILVGANSNTYLPLNSGSYFSSVTDANTCVSLSNTITINDVGIDQREKNDLINVFYNGKEYVISNKTNDDLVLELFNLTGELIYRRILERNEIYYYFSSEYLMFVKTQNPTTGTVNCKLIY